MMNIDKKEKELEVIKRELDELTVKLNFNNKEVPFL